MGEMIVEGWIKGEKVDILIDTGSSISLIGGETMKRIVDPKDIEAAEFDKIIAVNATETEVRGMVRQEITIGNYTAMAKLNILAEASYQILLGRDFMRENIQTINCLTNEITLKNGEMVKASDPKNDPPVTQGEESRKDVVGVCIINEK